MKTCSFLHAIFTEIIEVVEDYVKILCGEKINLGFVKTSVVSTQWNCPFRHSNVYQQHNHVTEIRKTITGVLKFTLIRYFVHCLCLFKHLKLLISYCIEIPVTIWHIVYI